MAALEVALAGRWAEWDGLDALSAAGLESAVGPLTTPQDADVGFAGGRAWLHDDRVLLVVLDAPPAPHGADAALASAGTPAASEPARLLVLGSATTDHIFPASGLVLVTAVPYEDAPAQDRAPRLLRAELFAPCSLEDWRVEYARLSAPARPHRW